MVTTETAATLRTAAGVLTHSRTVLEPALRAAVNTLPSSMRTIADYHFGWRDRLGRPTEATLGKALRPAFVLTSAEVVAGTAEPALPAAVAVELVHNFSLLHDDVMDGDPTRRHRPTAWSVFGRSAAILAGDALLTLAFDTLAATRHPAARGALRTLSEAVQDLVDGQCADLAFERRTYVSLSECLTMARKKTGALLGCACALGASFAGGSTAQVERLRQFGRHVGLAYQHVDDVLGIWGDPGSTGKPTFSDLRNRKKTLPVVAALASNTVAGREFAALYHRPAPLTDAELAVAADLVVASGGRAWSQSSADDLLARALRELESANPGAPAAARLGALAQLATHRDR